MAQACEECRFFTDVADPGEARMGVRRRRAPYPAVTEAISPIVAVWPWVNLDDGCGEFEASVTP